MVKHEQIIHLDLFSGIGGFSLAADRVWGTRGVRHIFCELDPFCQEVLRKHWPEARIYSEIRTFTKEQFLADSDSKKHGGLSKQPRKKISGTGNIHILTGGFPCQPFSQAGRRCGTEDDRFLWPEMRRVIAEFTPKWIIAENVRGFVTQEQGVVLEGVCTDLEALGYEVAPPLIIPAIAVGAPHRRDRVWFIAHHPGKRGGTRGTERKGHFRQQISELSNSDSTTARLQGEKRFERTEQAWKKRRTRSYWNEHWLTVAARLCRVDDGVPRRMDRNSRLKALGNAIVPQVAEEIMRAIAASV